ncbi:hypothetical protein BaRGS_00022511 [Batillaria attramentaria]|uniref:Uncharacterized protein n=1 Tax=Batillaria attramentaria TaxID=370345 RepID=A0ABD0KG24_9CAEN
MQVFLIPAKQHEWKRSPKVKVQYFRNLQKDAKGTERFPNLTSRKGQRTVDVKRNMPNALQRTIHISSSGLSLRRHRAQPR